jgi:hypothetical protein
MKHLITFLALIATQQQVQVSSFGSPQPTRNAFMRQISASIISFGTAANANAAQGGILRSDKCAYGEGSGCESLAGDNDFIKELQRKSAANKESAQKVRCFVRNVMIE